MTLVSYTSDSDGESDKNEPAAVDSGPPAKRPRVDDGKSLPSLPAAFHDLYASTVRTSTTDDPSLHQGRVRQVPHKVGNWPSHVYIKWHPPTEAFSLLTRLISTLQRKTDVAITSFLTSDLGVPLPLHISLSRPLSLTTSDKDEFLTELTASIKRSNIPPFDLLIRDVEWHRTEESGCSFLVLRLDSTNYSNPATSNNNKNPELTDLLKCCNKLAKEYGQPGLYEWASDASSEHESSSLLPQEPSPENSPAEETNSNKKLSVANAFHISIAWSFSPPSDELKQLTRQVFGHCFASTSTPVSSDTLQITSTTSTHIHVDAIKAKIGNVVTNIPLSRAGRTGTGRGKDANRLLGLVQ